LRTAVENAKEFVILPGKALRKVHFPSENLYQSLPALYRGSTGALPRLYQALPELYQPFRAPDGRFRPPSVSSVSEETAMANAELLTAGGPLSLITARRLFLPPPST
jgi:hypothetical protein